MLRRRLFQTTGGKAPSPFNELRLRSGFRVSISQIQSNYSHGGHYWPLPPPSVTSSLRICAQERGQIMAFFLFWFSNLLYEAKRSWFLLGHHFCVCWISCGAGQSEWNTPASWVHINAIKESLSPTSWVISFFHWPINVHILHLSYDFIEFTGSKQKCKDWAHE